MSRHRGEYIFRLGAHPLQASPFAGDASKSSNGWIGIPRTEMELTRICAEVTRLVDEVGGKARSLLYIQPDYFLIKF